MSRNPDNPVRDASRDGSAGAPACPVCPVCGAPLPRTRAQYCSHACRQRAFRQRQEPPVRPALEQATRRWQKQRTRVERTVYECPTCEQRYLGEQRCPDCQLFCRSLGLGGTCPDCDTLITLAELLGEEVLR